MAEKKQMGNTKGENLPNSQWRPDWGRDQRGRGSAYNANLRANGNKVESVMTKTRIKNVPHTSCTLVPFLMSGSVSTELRVSTRVDVNLILIYANIIIYFTTQLM